MGAAQSSRPATVTHEKPSQAVSDGESATKLLSRLQLGSTSSDRGTLALDDLTVWEDAVSNDPAKRLARTVLSSQHIWTALRSRDAVIADQHVFNLKLTHPVGNITNQMASGRCWLFATLNVARMAVMVNHKLDTLELSQSYLAFYDWLEKSNYFLEQMIELAEEPLDSRTVQYLCTSPQNDGGQFDMVVNLIEKYGIVPQSVYPESYNSSNSSAIDKLLTSKLREYAIELRDLHARTLSAVAESDMSKSYAQRKHIAIRITRQRKSEQMAEVYAMLSIALGKPPKPDTEFTWQFDDKDGKYQCVKSTPLQFYKSSCAPFNAGQCISLINDPRHDYDRLYTVERLGNVYNGRPVLYVNTTADAMMKVVVDLLKANQPVWFGCDVGQFSDSTLGIMDTALFDLETPFGVTLGMNKAQRLQTGESAMTHAMVITAAQLSSTGEPVRFRVQNSWSEARGDHGFFVMSADWFRQFVYQVVADRKYLSKEVKAIFEQGEPFVLPVWDPMGTLAKRKFPFGDRTCCMISCTP